MTLVENLVKLNAALWSIYGPPDILKTQIRRPDIDNARRSELVGRLAIMNFVAGWSETSLKCMGEHRPLKKLILDELTERVIDE